MENFCGFKQQNQHEENSVKDIFGFMSQNFENLKVEKFNFVIKKFQLKFQQQNELENLTR